MKTRICRLSKVNYILYGSSDRLREKIVRVEVRGYRLKASKARIRF